MSISEVSAPLCRCESGCGSLRTRNRRSGHAFDPQNRRRADVFNTSRAASESRLPNNSINNDSLRKDPHSTVPHTCSGQYRAGAEPPPQ